MFHMDPPSGSTAFIQALNSDEGILGLNIKDEDLPTYYWFRRLGLLEYKHINIWMSTDPRKSIYISRHRAYRLKQRT